MSLSAVGGLARAAANVIDVTAAPYNASPGNADNTSNFQSALNTLASLGGGILIVPPGYYSIQGQLNYSSSNASLTVSGYGQALSILVIKHTATALNVTYSYVGDNQSLVIKDIGFAPAPGGSGSAGIAVALAMPATGGSAWQGCRIENVDFGAQYPNYTVFEQAMSLTNIWRSRIANCNAHSNSGSGSVFLALNGKCIDNRVAGCNVDGYGIGVSVGAYSEGLHLIDTVFIGGTAVSTGTADFGNGNGVNLLGLYVTGCELNCTGTDLSLYQVNSGWISDTDISGSKPNSGGIGIAMYGCARLQVSKCLFDMSLDVANPSKQVGVMAMNSTSGGTVATTVDDCDFENTLVAVSLASGTTNFTGLGLRMFAPGNGTLVNTPINYGSYTQQPLVDNSGNTTNMIQWLATANATSNIKSARTIYSR